MPSLLCVRCGAPLPPEAAGAVVTCAFCHTTSTPAPRVVERTVDRVVERIVVRDASGVPSTLACLRCGASMRGLDVDGLHLSQCPACGGAWVPVATTAFLRKRSSDELRKAVARGEMLALATLPRAPLVCPGCKAPMESAGMTGTVHDVDV